ncbi:MAG: zinc ribbon domain-containing protein [Planctomycetes bacterium]|nr:zinc ribbon domain-containing protein [Planctomycetota bacterium]
MPTYEYACSACGHEFEEFQSIKADPIRTCPRCGKRKVERKIGIGGAVIFRGGGFYETDYRSADYDQAKKADAAPAAGSGAETAASGAAGSTKEQRKAPSDEPSAKGSRDGAKAEGASKAPTTEGAVSGASAASDRASAGPASTSGNAAGDGGSSAGRASGGRKNHAREGRGVGNVLQLGRAKPSGAKPTSKPSRTSAGKSSKRKGR